MLALSLILMRNKGSIQMGENEGNIITVGNEGGKIPHPKEGERETNQSGQNPEGS